MPGPLVHLGAVLTCTHGGPATALPSTTRVLLSGWPALTIADTQTVAGCPFQVPVPGGTKPQPCVTVRLEASTRVLIGGKPAVLLTPAAICLSAEQIPQGPPNAGGIQLRVLGK